MKSFKISSINLKTRKENPENMNITSRILESFRKEEVEAEVVEVAIRNKIIINDT
jgi:hypothetical protein